MAVESKGLFDRQMDRRKVLQLGRDGALLVAASYLIGTRTGNPNTGIQAKPQNVEAFPVQSYSERWRELGYNILSAETPVPIEDNILKSALWLDKDAETQQVVELPDSLSESIDSLLTENPWLSSMVDEIAFFSADVTPDFIEGKYRMAGGFDLVQSDGGLKRVLYLSIPRGIIEDDIDVNIPIGPTTNFASYEGSQPETYAQTFELTIAHEFGHAVERTRSLRAMRAEGMTDEQILKSMYMSSDPLYGINAPLIQGMADAIGLVTKDPPKDSDGRNHSRRVRKGVFEYEFRDPTDRSLIDISYKNGDSEWDYSIVNMGLMRPEVANMEAIWPKDLESIPSVRALFGPPHEMFADLFAYSILYDGDGLEKSTRNYFANLRSNIAQNGISPDGEAKKQANTSLKTSAISLLTNHNSSFWVDVI